MVLKKIWFIILISCAKAKIRFIGSFTRINVVWSDESIAVEYMNILYGINCILE